MSQHIEENAGTSLEPGDTVKVFFERRGGVIDYEIGAVVKCDAHPENFGYCIRLGKAIPDEFAIMRIDIIEEYPEPETTAETA